MSRKKWSRKKFAETVFGYGLPMISILGSLCIASNQLVCPLISSILIAYWAGSGLSWSNTLIKEWFQLKNHPNFFEIVIFVTFLMAWVLPTTLIISQVDWINKLDIVKQTVKFISVSPLMFFTFLLSAWLTNIGIECRDSK